MNDEQAMATAVQEYVAIGKRMNQGIPHQEWIDLRWKQLGIDSALGFRVSKTVAQLYPSL